MSNDETRSISLRRLLGLDKNQTLAEALQGVERTLEAEGHQVKSYDGDTKKGIVEDLQDQLRDMLMPLSESIPDDLINTIIASVMGALAQMPADEEPVEEIIEEPMPETEVMADGEDDEEEEELPVTLEFVKQMMTDNNAMFEGVQELVKIVPSIVAMADSVKDLGPLMQAAEGVKALAERVEMVEKQLALTPQIASKSDDNLVTDSGAQDEIRKSADEYETILGERVRKI